MHPQGKDIMTSVVYMVERLAHAERRFNATSGDVRNAIARRVGLASGTIENIQRGRLKFVERVETKIRAAFIRLLEDEIKKATHELQVARLCADRVDCDEVRAAEAALGRTIDEAQKVISRA